MFKSKPKKLVVNRAEWSRVDLRSGKKTIYLCDDSGKMCLMGHYLHQIEGIPKSVMNYQYTPRNICEVLEYDSLAISHGLGSGDDSYLSKCIYRCQDSEYIPMKDKEKGCKDIFMREANIKLIFTSGGK